MFKELAPVLRHRAILLTITSIENDQIRVNVVPKKLKDDENKALTTPLTITGTAEELDAELGSTLVDFVAAHLQLKNTLKQAKADMEEAAKAAQAEARAKSKTPAKKDATTTTTSASKPSQPAKASTEPVQPPPLRTESLFDMPAPMPLPVAPSAASIKAEPTEEDEEILAEIKEDETEGNENLEEAA